MILAWRLHFGGELLAERDLFFEGVEIDPSADVPIPDLVGVFFRVFGEYSARRTNAKASEKLKLADNRRFIHRLLQSSINLHALYV